MFSISPFFHLTVFTNNHRQDASLVHYSGYTEAEIKPVFLLLIEYILRPKHKAFFNKYASKKFSKGNDCPCHKDVHTLTHHLFQFHYWHVNGQRQRHPFLFQLLNPHHDRLCIVYGNGFITQLNGPPNDEKGLSRVVRSCKLFFFIPPNQVSEQVAVTIYTRCEVNDRIRSALCLELSHSPPKKSQLCLSISLLLHFFCGVLICHFLTVHSMLQLGSLGLLCL